ncbi:MAG: VCBS repeat-containing protein, partial [Pyrinomonadaceae bacterium]|nr:VCBS repeat-containing protein [Pyrinomonadaceae bacterium]
MCTSISSNSGFSIPVGPNPRQVLVGDINSDNIQDAVVVTGSNTSGGLATVLINNGNGNLAPFTTIQVNFSIGAATLTDIDLDGSLDLAIAGSSGFSSGSSPLYIYFGKGTGSFTSPSISFFQGSAVGVSSGDFNSDGLPDVVIASSGNNFGAVYLFLNSGNRSLTPVGNFSISGTPRDLKVADFNGDGFQDVFVSSNNGSGSILSGNGMGNFQLATNFLLFPNSSSSSFFNPVVAVGDVNNDGKPDIVATSIDTNSFSVLINNGTSGFAAPVINTFSTSTISIRSRSIIVGQFIGDANLDVALSISDGFSDGVNAVIIVPGNGSANFNLTNFKIAPTGSQPLFITSGDFNGDNRNDLITANAGSSDVSVLLNNGNDGYGPNTFATNLAPTQIVAADFNGDGNLDTATSNQQQQQSPSQNGIFVSFGNGTGGVSGTLNLSLGTTQSLLAGDVNNDSRADLIVAHNSTNIYVYVNSGTTPAFNNPPTAYPLSFIAKGMVLGDFNNDGRKDLIAASANSNLIAVLLGASNGVFSAPMVFASPANSAAITAADFNNDGKLDIALAGTSFSGVSGVFTLLGTGTGTFSQVSETFAFNNNNPPTIVSNDFNGDGKIDIALIGGTNFSNSGGTITVAFGDGDGTFSQAVGYSVPSSPSSLVTGDFNGDNRPDLVTSSRFSNSYTVLINSENGVFRTGNSFLAGISPEAITFGDYNNDGRNDFATANRGANNFSILLNTCLEAVTKTDYTGEGKTDFAVFRPSNGTWYVLGSNNESRERKFGQSGDIPAPGDFDGDGRSDLAVFRPSNGTWYVTRSSNDLTFAVKWGTSGDIPVANDYDGDGRTDVAVFRPSNGVWYIIRSSAPNAFYAIQFGSLNDRPVAADYDGDGRADLAVYRAGLWIILQSRDSSVRFQQFGLTSDKTVPGDYDGDGNSDIAVYRGGVWYIFQSKTGSVRVEN